MANDLFDEYTTLVVSFRNGDEQAYEEIYKKSERMVYTICYGILKNEDDAFDAMQETYLTVYKKLGSLEDNKTFVSWLKRIANTKSLDAYRKKKGDVSYDDAVATDESLQLDDNLENLPDSYIMKKTKREALDKIIKEALTDVQYQTIHMHYYSEMSVEQIAELMDCPVGTVKTRLKSSRAKIKEGIKKYEKDNKDAFAAAPAVPFLTRFFQTASQDLTVPPVDISSLVGGGTSKAVASVAAKETVKAGLLSTTAGKITAGALALALVASAAVTTKVIVNGSKDEVVESTEEVIETELTEVDLVSYTDMTVFTANVNVLNYNGHSYACYYGCATWEEASELCKTQGGYLAVINSQEENDVLFTFTRSLGYDNVYFGLSDSLNEGEWGWVTGDAVDYANWNPGEPNAFTDSEDYAVFADDGTWNDGEFTPRIENGLVCFICEWDYYVTGIANLVPEDLVVTVEESDVVYDFDPNTVVACNEWIEVDGYVSGYSYRWSIPQINIDSPDAQMINEEIRNTITGWSERLSGLSGEEQVEYRVFWPNDSVFSLVIRNAGFAWNNEHMQFVFCPSTGALLTNSEILEVAGLTEDTFRELAVAATIDKLNEQYAWWGNGEPIVVDGALNDEWVNNCVEPLSEEEIIYIYGGIIDDELNSINMYMPMFLNDDGEIIIWRPSIQEPDLLLNITTHETSYAGGLAGI